MCGYFVSWTGLNIKYESSGNDNQSDADEEHAYSNRVKIRTITEKTQKFGERKKLTQYTLVLRKFFLNLLPQYFRMYFDQNNFFKHCHINLYSTQKAEKSINTAYRI
jgi:hypothetical protein